MKEYIIGKNTILETIKYKKDKIIKILTSSKDQKNILMDEIIKNKISLEYVSKKTLDKLAKTSSHGNFLAKIEREFYDLKNFLKNDFLKNDILKRDISSLLILDNILDPHNMGAIIRASECFKIDGIIFSKNRGVGITPTVSKVSSGASELVPLIKVSNISDAIRKCRDYDFTIIATDVKKESLDLFKFKFPKKFVLIIGSEDRGVSEICKKLSDVTLKIPMYGKIDSLNVSQATAVILSFFRHQASL